jgi:glycosyltransferase involved in cell wall biosynthesis
MTSNFDREITNHYGTARRDLDTQPISRSRQAVCMLAYTAYESDGRVRRYAESLANRGDHVDVIALSSGSLTTGVEKLNGVAVHRIQYRECDERHKWTYAWRLLRFLIIASVFLVRHQRRTPYGLIHVHNVPDFLVFAAWYPKFKGAKLILDIHDIVPELFASKFGVNADSLYVRLLKLIEKASVKFVDHVIISNDLWPEKLMSRSGAKDKCSVFVNYVDPVIFHRRARSRHDGKVILLFPGTFQWHQGLDVAIEALAHIKERLPTAELHLYGGGGVESDLMEQAARIGLSASIRFCGGVSYDRIAEVIANADIGVVPKRANSFGNEAYSTKIMEFMSQGVPLVVSRTKIDSFYYDDSLVRFFTSGDSKAMAEAVFDVLENKEMRENMVAKGLAYAERNNWGRKQHDYFALVDSLASGSMIRPVVGSTLVDI